MKLFIKPKASNQSCCSKEDLKQNISNDDLDSKIIILGSGCSKCNLLEANTIEALKELEMDPTVNHITDFVKISSYGVMSTPALVVDNNVVSYGKVCSKDEIKKLIIKVRGHNG